MTRRSSLALLLVGVPLAILAVVSCRRADELAVGGGDVVVLEPLDRGAYRAGLEQVVAKEFPEATRYPLQRWVDAFSAAFEKNATLVIPDAQRLPADLWHDLTNFIERGGVPVFIGSRPFDDRVWSSPRGIKSEQELARDWVNEAREVTGLSDVGAWNFFAVGSTTWKVRKSTPPEIAWPATWLSVDHVETVCGLKTDVAAGAMTPGVNAFVVHVRGDSVTTRIVLECVDDNATAWRLILPLTDSWQPRVIRQESFLPVDPSNKGTLEFARLRSISVSLSQEHAPQAPGPHEVGISDIRFLSDSRPAELACGWPDLPLLAPPVRRYVCHPATIHVGRDTEVRWTGGAVGSPFPRALGGGGIEFSSSRWIPLAEARSGAGDVLGWPASIFVDSTRPDRSRVWGWVALDASAEAGPVIGRLLSDVVQRLRNDHVLVVAGLDRAVWQEGERMEITARRIELPGARGNSRLVAELVRRDGRVDRRVTAEPEDDVFRADLGRAPETDGSIRDYTLRSSLVDVGGRKELDHIEQEIRVLPADRSVASDGRVTVAGHLLAKGGRPFSLVGVRYTTRAEAGLQAGEKGSAFLSPSMFNPETLRSDLDRLRELGVNHIAVTYDDVSEAGQLRYVIEELRQRQMTVRVDMPSLAPPFPEVDRARLLVEAAHLAGEPVVALIGLNRRDGVAASGPRAVRDLWAPWVLEQYGSAENAAKRLGLAEPPVPALSTNELLRTVQRRFLRDVFSRGYGLAVRTLRAAGVTQPVTADQELFGADLLADRPEVGSGVAHLDVVSICTAIPRARGGDPLDAGYLAAHARGVSGGKPVLWSAMGPDVGVAPTVADLTYQWNDFEAMFQLVRTTRSAGGIAAAYAGGWSAVTGGDRGITHADGSLRPVAESFRAFSHNLRDGSLAAPLWRGREINESANPDGVRSLWKQWRSEYHAELQDGRVEDVRPRDFGRETSGLVVRNLEGKAAECPEPLESVNAEWGAILRNEDPLPREAGRPLRALEGTVLELQVVNTGAATWSAGDPARRGTAYVQCLRPGDREELLRLPRVAFGEKAVVRISLTSSGEWVLRPWLRGIGGFGEALHIAVDPAP